VEVENLKNALENAESCSVKMTKAELRRQLLENAQHAVRIRDARFLGTVFAASEYRIVEGVAYTRDEVKRYSRVLVNTPNPRAGHTPEQN
jgi:hypothetical protein